MPMTITFHWPKYGIHDELEVREAASMCLPNGTRYTVYERLGKVKSCYILVSKTYADNRSMVTVAPGNKTAREFKNLAAAMRWLVKVA